MFDLKFHVELFFNSFRCSQGVYRKFILSLGNRKIYEAREKLLSISKRGAVALRFLPEVTMLQKTNKCVRWIFTCLQLATETAK